MERNTKGIKTHEAHAGENRRQSTDRAKFNRDQDGRRDLRLSKDAGLYAGGDYTDGRGLKGPHPRQNKLKVRNKAKFPLLCKDILFGFWLSGALLSAD